MAERLYRSMKAASDGHPEPGRTARALGARPGIDVRVSVDGLVVGGEGGMSVAPDSPENLPAHRRPPEHGGTGKDPIWELDITELGNELVYREDPLMPGVHGFIEPVLPTTFDAYESSCWRRVTPGNYHSFAMAVTDEFRAALASEHRLDGLRSAAEHALQAGTPREQVIGKLEALRAGSSDSDEDVVLEVLDFVTGWCSPHVRL